MEYVADVVAASFGLFVFSEARNVFAVQFVDTHPAIDESSEVDLDQEYVYHQDLGWFPHKIRTAIIQNKTNMQ